MNKMKSFVVGLAVLGISSLAHAIPSLQLYIDPSLNPGAYYDTTTDTWVFAGDSSQFTLTAFALDRNFGSTEGNAFENNDVSAYLSLALINDSIADGTKGDVRNDLGSLSIDGNVVDTWTYDRPVLGAHDDLAPHGIYPEWIAEYAFNFGTYGDSVFDTEPPIDLGQSKTGWRVDFSFDLSMLDFDELHIDLYTKNHNGQLFKNAPFSHDAEAAPVPTPEPATLFLVGSGLFGLAFVSRKRK